MILDIRNFYPYYLALVYLCGVVHFIVETKVKRSQIKKDLNHWKEWLKVYQHTDKKRFNKAVDDLRIYYCFIILSILFWPLMVVVLFICYLFCLFLDILEI